MSNRATTPKAPKGPWLPGPRPGSQAKTKTTERVAANATAWAYLVASSAQQSEALSNQERWARETAAKNGWTITHVEKGVSSAKSGLRELMGSVMDRLRRLPPSERPVRLLMIRLDRFGRDNPLEMAGVIGELQKLRVTVHTRDDGDYKIAQAADSSIPATRLFLAAIESENQRDRQLETAERKRNRGAA